MKRFILFIGIFLSFLLNSFGQYKIIGSVKDAKTNEALIGANIFVAENMIGVTSDFDGKFTISLPKGQYTLKISYVGYTSKFEKIIIQKSDIHHDFLLVPTAETLDEVVVAAKSHAQEKREAPFQVSVIDMKTIQVQTQPVTSLVNQVSGVRVRENGGMGSNANIMLNGIGGKGVRIFVDDIPTDLLGGGMAINNIATSMIDYIEIYKGVIPSKFGTDALGGVLNMVTRNKKRSYTDISISAGSFGSYKANINNRLVYGEKQNLYIGVNGFYNHSDNNYRMDNVKIIIDELGNTKNGSAKRFNDEYTSYLGQLNIGLTKLSFADDIQLNITGSHVDKEWQHGLTAEEPWGETFSEESNFNIDLKWKKYSLLSGLLDASLVVGYNYSDFYFEDIAAKTYYWGTENNMPQFVKQVTVGEATYSTDGRTPRIFTNNFFARTNLTYHFAQNHSLTLTSMFSLTDIRGHDYRGIATFGTDVLDNPQTLKKNYVGVSLESKFLGGKITNIASLKNFYNKSEIAILDDSYKYTGQQNSEYIEFGYGNAMKLCITPQLSSTLNYEYSTRIPDTEELFGNLITIYPNPDLKPERSHNLDIGFRYNAFNNKLSAEVNGFYRYTQDLIFLKTLLLFRSIYLNLQTTETTGCETELKFAPSKNLSMYANLTYQYIVLKELDENSELSERYINNQIPNIPYFFGNAGINYTLPISDGRKGKLQFFYSFNYVHDFYLTWEADGRNSTKTTIPEQVVHNMGVAYSIINDKLSFSFECKNLTDEGVFDNYSVQKPGRSFFFKLRYSIEK